MFWTGGKNIYNKDELTTMVYNTIEYYEEANKRIGDVNKKLKEDAEKIVRAEYEQRIAQLEEKLRLSYGEFATQKEKDAYDDFEKRHMHERTTMKAQGGKCPYLIPTGTGIGTNLKVVCPICGKSEDITDLEAW